MQLRLQRSRYTSTTATPNRNQRRRGSVARDPTCDRSCRPGSRAFENLRAGKRVTKGETLIKLDPTDYQLNLNQLLAQQKQEAAELQSNNVSITNTEKLIELAERQTRLAVNDRKRAVKLKSNQAISASEVDIAERAELTAQSSLIEVNNNRRDLGSETQHAAREQTLTEVLVQRAKLKFGALCRNFTD